MNKNIIILLFFAMIGFHYESICAQQNEQVPLHPVATGDGTLSSEIIGTLDSPQRSPIYIPSVFLTDYTLLFEENCIGCQVQILQDETVVYSSFVDEDGIVLLPATLTGECELRLYWGTIVFVGEFLL